MSIVNEIDIWSYRYRRGPFRFRFCFGFISVYKAKVISSILSIYGRLLASIGVYTWLFPSLVKVANTKFLILSICIGG